MSYAMYGGEYARGTCPFCHDENVDIVGTAYGAPGCGVCVNICLYNTTLPSPEVQETLSDAEKIKRYIIRHAMRVQGRLWRLGVKDTIDEPA